MAQTPGPWRIGKTGDSIISDSVINTDPSSDLLHREQIYLDHYGGYPIAESIFNQDDLELIAAAPEMKKQLNQLAEIIARNLTAWDTSKDSSQGMLPEVYLSNKVWYERLTGEEYRFIKAVKKFNIE